MDSGWWIVDYKKEKRVDVPSFFFGFCPYLYATISHFIVIFLGGFNSFSYLCSEITICCELCLKAMMDTKEFGRRIGLSPRLVNRELDFFATEYPLAQDLISRSFLSEQLKRYYWQSYNYRRTTLTSH